MNWIDRILGNSPKQSKQEIVKEFEEQVDKIIDAHTAPPKTQVPPVGKQHNGYDDSGVRCLAEFIITNNDDVILNVRWDKDNDITARSIGQLLYQINNGDFKETSKNILLQAATENPQKEDFVVKCFENWKDVMDQSPLIKPSQVFGMGRQPGGAFQQGYKPQ